MVEQSKNNEPARQSRFIYEFSKRCFDILAALFGILLLSPLFILIACAIKITSSGPVFYRGLRTGLYGRTFHIYKFRSMMINADQGAGTTSQNDSRITPVGKIIRKYKLDEIPQLFNVLVGNMSFVGPRPEVKMYVDMLSQEERKTIFSVRPGMTDLASLWNFHEGEILAGSSDPEKAYLEKIRPQKIELQLEYVKERSFWLDIKLILKTIVKIFQ